MIIGRYRFVVVPKKTTGGAPKIRLGFTLNNRFFILTYAWRFFYWEGLRLFQHTELEHTFGATFTNRLKTRDSLHSWPRGLPNRVCDIGVFQAGHMAKATSHILRSPQAEPRRKVTQSNFLLSNEETRLCLEILWFFLTKNFSGLSKPMHILTIRVSAFQSC